MQKLTRLFAVLVMVFMANTGAAQGLGRAVSSVLTVESDRMFTDSKFGQRVAREIDAAQAVLLAENRSKEAQLTAEEKTLTQKRKQMTPEDFRAVAEAFDARVVQIRTEQDQKARDISDRREQEEAAFVQVVRPILSELMRESGALVILERRNVLLSDISVDITQEAIRRLNTVVGDGTELRVPDPEKP